MWLASAGHPFPLTIGAVLGVVFVIAGTALIRAGSRSQIESAPAPRTQPKGAMESGLGFLLAFVGLALILFGLFLGSCTVQIQNPVPLGFGVVFIIAGVVLMRAGLGMARMGGGREINS